MRIIHVTSYYSEKLSKGYQVYELVKEQIKSGHEVHIVTCDRSIGLANYLEHAEILGVPIKLKSGIEMGNLGETIHRLPILFKIIGRSWYKNYSAKISSLEPDTLIVHNIMEFQSLRLLFFFKKLKSRIIFDDHTTINVIRTDFLGRFSYFVFRLLFARRLYGIAHRIVGISDSCLNVLKNCYGLEGNKVVMIPLGTDTSIYFQDVNKRKVYRDQYNILKDQILVVYTGKVYEEKKVDLIIQALNDEIFEDKKITIHIVGTIYTSYRKKLENSINVSNNTVVLIGNQSHDDLASVYNAADIAVWPAHTTISTLDASACGCPIICSDYKSERFKNQNGIGIKDGDLEQLKKALFKLIFSEDSRIKMGQRGIQLINSENTWDIIADKFNFK